MSFSKFTIYGERCSGTNYLAKLMYDNFDVEYVLLPDSIYGAKHWFGNSVNITHIQQSTDCIILCIVRDPIDWILSFFQTPHQQSPHRIIDLKTFVSTEFYSTLHSTGEELELRRYKDIFEMRDVKNFFLHKTIPILTPNSCFLLYEQLKNSPDKWLSVIQSKFNLHRKRESFFIEKRKILPQAFPVSKKSIPQLTAENNFQMSDELIRENYSIEDLMIKNIIFNRLNFELEEELGYDKVKITTRLK